VDLRSAMAAQGIALDDLAGLDGALGTSAGGRIQILKGLPPAGEFVVLVQEFAPLCSAVGYVRSGRRRSVTVWPTLRQFPRLALRQGQVPRQPAPTRFIRTEHSDERTAL
jgi:hypothetical protein